MSSEQSTTQSFAVNVCGLTPPANWTGGPKGLRFLDPGICSPDGDFPRYLPPDLPLGPQQVKAILAHFSQLARECRDPSELLGLRDNLAEDFYTHTSLALRSELIDLAAGVAGEKLRLKALIQAQTTLCLAWVMEKTWGEIAGLEENLAGQWRRFNQNIGLGQDEPDAQEEESPLPDSFLRLESSKEAWPKPRLIEAILAFVPPVTPIFTADEELKTLWGEYSVVFQPAQAVDLAANGLDDLGLAQVWQTRATGHLLTLKRREQPGKPWLNGPRTVFFAKL